MSRLDVLLASPPPSPGSTLPGALQRLYVELHENGFVTVSGDTAALKDFVLKPLGFTWCKTPFRQHARNTGNTQPTNGWWKIEKGGRDVIERLKSRIDPMYVVVEVVDHSKPLARCSLADLLGLDSDSDDEGTATLPEEAAIDDEGISDEALVAALDAATISEHDAKPPGSPEDLSDDAMVAALEDFEKHSATLEFLSRTDT